MIQPQPFEMAEQVKDILAVWKVRRYFTCTFLDLGITFFVRT